MIFDFMFSRNLSPLDLKVDTGRWALNQNRKRDKVELDREVKAVNKPDQSHHV